ncbi:MAG: acyltransferase [candidate division KSB1 bacterium]|nr:acyltransferase [candidate division KSB1 bacterium]
MKIGFVQINCEFGEKEKNLAKVIRLFQPHRADLLVLPELFSSGYVFTSKSELMELAESIPNGYTTTALAKLAREKNVHIVAGVAERHNGNIYNSAILVGPNGYLGSYRKAHLFDRELQWFTPGDQPFRIFDLGQARIGIMICFDWIFPEVARDLALKGADIICHPSNLILPYCQKAMITRSIENAVYTITANRIGTEQRGEVILSFTGESQIVDPRGNILAKASDQEEIAIVNINPLKARNKNFTEHNHLFRDRRTDLYQLDRKSPRRE